MPTLCVDGYEWAVNARTHFSPRLSTTMKTRTPHDWTWEAWRTRLRRLLGRTESRYDLSQGEILLATGTASNDLEELWNYGWTPGEAAHAITEALGLR
jgi:hypothetical protein